MAALVLLAVLAQAASPPPPAPEATSGLAVVTFLDGSTLPLHGWSLSYDYLTWPRGQTQLQAIGHHRKSPDILLGKKAVPAAGAKMALAFAEVPREVLVDGRPQQVVAQVAREVTLTALGGKSTKLKVEAPARDLLAPGLDKSVNLLPRSLDLVGETLGGTRRTLCVLSFSILVDCGSSPADVVAKVEFSR